LLQRGIKTRFVMRLVSPWILAVFSPVCSANNEGNASGPIVDSGHEIFNPRRTQDRHRFLESTYLKSCDELTNELQCCDGSSELGDEACGGDTGKDGQFQVDTGSCLAHESCTNAGKKGSAKIGKGSCIELLGTVRPRPCNSLGAFGGSAILGDGSCIGISACQTTGVGGNITIGNSSCIGSYPCYNSFGHNSFKNSAVLGDDVCKGDAACQSITYAMRDIVIESGSCHGSSSACIHLGARGANDGTVSTGTSPVHISKNACIGGSACGNQGMYGGFLSIGENSCQCSKCCFFNPKSYKISGHFEVGKSSCLSSNGNHACYVNPTIEKYFHYIIGDNSCSGKEACKFFSFPEKVTIGSGSCQCDNCCSCLDGTKDVPDGTCNSLGQGTENCCTDSSTKNPNFVDSGTLTLPNEVIQVSESPTTHFQGEDYEFKYFESKFVDDEGGFGIELNYTVGKSVDQLTITLLDENCTDLTIESIINLATDYSEESNGSFLEKITVDKQKLSTSKLVTRSEGSSKGTLAFCVKAEGLSENRISVSFQQDKLNLVYDLTDNSFEILSNGLKADDINTTLKNVTTGYSIIAHRCTSSAYEEIVLATPLQQNGLVFICIEPNSTDVKISTFNLNFEQNDYTFQVVDSGLASSILSSVYTEGDKTKIVSRLVTALFNNGKESFTASGNANLVFKTATRKLDLMRLLNNKDNAGEASFGMDVELQKTMNTQKQSHNISKTFVSVLGTCVLLSVLFIVIKKMK